MKVLLLVAGKSQRFWPLSDKSLFHVCGKSPLEWQIERLKLAGCDDIVVVAGPHNVEKTKELVPGIPVLVQEDMSLGTRGALLSALPQIPNGPVMVVSGNDMVDSDAYQLVKEAAARPGVDGVFLAKHMEKYFPGGYLTMNGEKILDIVEKPGEGKEPSNLVNIVVHVHNDYDALMASLQTIPDPQGDGYSQAEQTLLKEKHYIAVTYRGCWQALKYPWYMLSVMEELMKTVTHTRIHPSAVIHPTAVIEGAVHIEEGVVVEPLAIIHGPTTIGAHSVIGNHCIVRSASIGKHCKIGSRSEVKGSVLSDYVKTHGSYIGDSVIGENVNIGTGCVLGNLRFDEREVHSMVGNQKVGTGRRKFGAAIGNDARLGMKVGTNPGTKIGRNSFVGGGCMLNDDVPDGMFVRMQGGEITMTPNLTRAPHHKEGATKKKAEKKL